MDVSIPSLNPALNDDWTNRIGYGKTNLKWADEMFHDRTLSCTPYW